MTTGREPTQPSRLLLWVVILLSILALFLVDGTSSRVKADGARLDPIIDTYVASGQPSQSFGQNRTMKVGYDQFGNYQVERTLVKFLPDGIPAGSRIASAKLQLYLSGATRDDAPLTIQAHRVRSLWAENITWNEHLGLTADPSPAASTSVPAVLGWYSWDVTAALQAWSNQRDTADFSLLLRSNVTSGQHERAFWSKDCTPAECGTNQPYLEVQFERPTPTPTFTPDAPRLRASLNQQAITNNQLQYEIVVVNASGYQANQVTIRNEVPSGVTVVRIFDGGRYIASIPPQILWQSGYLSAGNTLLARYVVQVPGLAAAGESGSGAALPEPALTEASPPPAEQTPAPAAYDPAGSDANITTITALRAQNRPAIDGDLSEWAGLTAIRLDSLPGNYSTIVGEFPSLADLSATVRALWMADTLFLAAQINDNVKIGNDSPNLWLDDVIELAVHVAAANRSHQFSLCVDGRQADQGTPIYNLTYGRRMTAAGWTLEVAIPISVLGSGTLAPGQQYPFNMALWDDDIGGGSSGQTHLFWQSNSTYSYQQDWGTLNLSNQLYAITPPGPTVTFTPTPTLTPSKTPTPTITRTPRPTVYVYNAGAQVSWWDDTKEYATRTPPLIWRGPYARHNVWLPLVLR